MKKDIFNLVDETIKRKLNNCYCNKTNSVVYNKKRSHGVDLIPGMIMILALWFLIALFMIIII